MTPPTASGNSGLAWQADWRTTAFTLLFLPVFVRLGFWQLERAEEKATIHDSVFKR